MADYTLGISRLEAVGESNYQRGLKHARRYAATAPLWVQLIPEPRNKYDKNAVRIVALLGNYGPTVGYLRRTDAKTWQHQIMAVPGRVVVPAQVFGGTKDKPSLGIWIGEQYG